MNTDKKSGYIYNPEEFEPGDEVICFVGCIGENIPIMDKVVTVVKKCKSGLYMVECEGKTYSGIAKRDMIMKRVK